MKQFFVVLALLLAAGCGDGKKEVADQIDEAASWVVDLTEHDVPLIVELGDRTTLGTDSVAVVWNEEFGQLEVAAGEHFAITISEEPGDLGRVKADLDRDMLRKHTMIEETPDLLIYRSQFPDEDLVFIHFQRILTVGDRSFVVGDATAGRFNEREIKRMAASVAAKPAL